MDPLTIGASVVTLLTPYVADAGKELVKTVGEAGVQKTKELMLWLKARFAGDAVATADLSRFETDPQGYAAGVKGAIDHKATDDPAFSAEIAQRVKDLGPTLTILQDFETAKNMTGLKSDRVHSGQISITQKGTTADGVVAADVKVVE